MCCDANEVCVGVTCCDTASAVDCSVTDEDIGYDENDCVQNVAGAGQCLGGWGYHIAAYDQSSTHENAIGPGTVDVAGCADVTYARCMTVLVGISKDGPVFECWLDIASGNITENMGTHDECPSE